MAKHATQLDRRRFLTTTLAGVVAVPILGFAGGRTVRAADMPKLKLDDPMAQQLNYVHNAEKVKGDDAYTAGANCANCSQWTGGDAQWGGCNIFPGKAVNAKGWCTAWSKAG